MLRKKIAIERADSMLLRIRKNGMLKEEKKMDPNYGNR